MSLQPKRLDDRFVLGILNSLRLPGEHSLKFGRREQLVSLVSDDCAMSPSAVLGALKRLDRCRWIVLGRGEVRFPGHSPNK
jgi:hypothetical protein